MMRKSPDEKAESRFWGFVTAEKIEWERLIENPDLIKEIQKIQRSYSLPIFTKGAYPVASKEVADWMGWNEPIEINKERGELILGEKGLRREKLAVEVKELATRFGIPPKFYSSLHRMVVMNTTYPDTLSAGFPSFKVHKGKDGKRVFECIITPETDLDNPLVMYVIKHWQGLNKERLPIPQPMRDNARRLDWRPVWEWRKRHPNITVNEIADMLGKNRVTVSRALERLDKEYPLQT